jgi:hypothetical protein
MTRFSTAAALDGCTNRVISPRPIEKLRQLMMARLEPCVMRSVLPLEVMLA